MPQQNPQTLFMGMGPGRPMGRQAPEIHQTPPPWESTSSLKMQIHTRESGGGPDLWTNEPLRLDLRSMVTLCFPPSRACSMASADMRTFFRAGFFTPIRSTTFSFRSSIWRQNNRHDVGLRIQIPRWLCARSQPEDIIPTHLLVALADFGLEVVSVLVDLVDGALELLAEFLLMHKTTTTTTTLLQCFIMFLIC
ncbi:hypothetical protein EYF80_040986 [Liparis tanakae]|uniref:Uncharacterized protein n=1 Tax=Liparis tanakae TaxID=230148 RepID=A0A4Z2G6E2_9TELE|nr:hypothetical protein EYF80_040986 [Liparis tanakae]